MLVFYNYITNDHEFSDFKQDTFIISQFGGSGVRLCLLENGTRDPLLRERQGRCSVVSAGLCSHPKARTGKSLLSGSLMLLAEFSRGPQHWVGSRLETPFMPTVPCQVEPDKLFNVAVYFFKVRGSASLHLPVGVFHHKM